MKKLDKKQVPQFAALCVLSAGVFGYFVVKIVTPSPAAAGTRPSPTAPAALTASAAGPASDGKTGPDPAAPVAEAEAPAPTPGMRDPFVVGYVDPKTLPVAPSLPAAPGKPAKAAVPQLASIHEVGPAPAGVPAAPVLPFGLKSLTPLPAAPALPGVPWKPAAPARPAPPAWTVTGVLQNEEGQVAILRSGEARRIVRTGDFVDSAFRVVAVTRTAVTLRHDKTFYYLMLGGAKPATVPPAKTGPPSGQNRGGIKPLPKTPDATQARAAFPIGTDAGLAEVLRAALMLARSYMTPAQTEVEVCLAAFHARRALPPRVAMRFLDGSVPATVSQEARTRLALGRNLYRNGQRSEGRAQWHQVLAMNDLDAADEARKMLDRFN